jgi:hypothetical protein
VLTRGNALFLRQLVDGEIEAGQLREAGGVWQWSGRPAVSAGLAELVQSRMGRLPEPLIEVVDVLALGEPLGVPVLSRLTSPPDVEEAEVRGLIDPRLMTVAARDAIRLLDVALAEQLARVAVDASGDFDARLTLALALSWLNRGADAEREFAALADRARTAQERVTVAAPSTANLFWTGRDPARAEEVLRAATAEAPEDARPVLAAARAAFHAFLGRPGPAVEDAAEALASPELPDVGVLLAAYGSVVGLGALGRADEIEPIAARAYTVAPLSFATAVGAFGLCDIHMMALHAAGHVETVHDLAQTPGCRST